MGFQQFEPFCLYRNVATGHINHNLRAVLPKALTVSAGYRCERMHKSNKTLFREVEFVPWQQALPPGADALMHAPVATQQMTRAEYIQAMADTLTEAIFRRWVPGKFHRVYHSAGMDSRIISAAIKRLRDLHGDAWLGDLLFVCIGNEGDAAEQIIAAEGWEPERMLCIRDVGPLVARMTDIRQAGRWLNGCMCQAVDYNWPLTEYLQEIGAAPADANAIQVVSGRNETLMGATMPEGNRMEWAWREAYDSFLSTSRYKAPDVIFPFGAFEVVKLGLVSSVRLNWATPELDARCGFRRDISTVLCPALTDIPRGALAMSQLDADAMHALVIDYSKSWYGMMVWPKATRDVSSVVLGYHSWWGAWSAAALCEALLQEGYKLNVG